MKNYCIRNLKMYPDEWERLEQLAIETHSANRDGPHHLIPSWIALIRRVARGELLLVEAKRNKQLEAIDKAMAENTRVAKRLEQRRQASLFETEPA